MKVFVDTSSLFKLYHLEDGTKELEALFERNNITAVFLSEITKVEFSSTIWKKVRMRELKTEQANVVCKLFEADFPKFQFIMTDAWVIETAKRLIEKYGEIGLRTLDSIQLSTCLQLRNKVDLFLTSDKLLLEFLELEELKTKF